MRKKSVKANPKKREEQPVLKDWLDQDLVKQLQNKKKELKDQKERQEEEEKRRKIEEKRKKEANKSFEELLNDSNLDWKSFK